MRPGCTTCQIQTEWHIITQTPHQSEMARIQGLRRADAIREAQNLSRDLQALGWNLTAIGPQGASTWALFFTRPTDTTPLCRNVYAQRVYRMTLCDDLTCPERSTMEARYARLGLAERYPSNDMLALGEMPTIIQSCTREILGVAAGGSPESPLYGLASDLDSLMTLAGEQRANSMFACAVTLDQALQQHPDSPSEQARLRDVQTMMRQWIGAQA